eukprot:COSAG04_NODE_2692_length_3724_cov_2.689379_2_plen_47_part_00
MAFLILHTGRSHTQGSCADGYLVVSLTLWLATTASQLGRASRLCSG